MHNIYEEKYYNSLVDIRKIGNYGKVESFNRGKIFQMSRVKAQSRDQIYGQVAIAESFKKTQVRNPQVHFIPSLQDEIILLFGSSLLRSNVTVQMYQQFPQLNFPIR